MPLARADLESLLRTRQLDRTLPAALPDPHMGPEGAGKDPGGAGQDPAGAGTEAGKDDYAFGPTGVAALDARLGGGLPRGQLSEIVGPRSSGRASLLLSMCAAATARGELVALVDAVDMLDVASAEAAGVDLARLLWIRGHVVTNPGLCRDMNQRAMEQAIRALTLVLSAGNFGLVAFDAGEAPAGALRRLPFTTWLRLQRMVEGQQTICVLVGSEPMARSSAGLTIRMGQDGQGRRDRQDGRANPIQRRPVLDMPERNGARASGVGVGPHASKKVDGCRFAETLFEGLNVEIRVIRARTRACEETAVSLNTAASNGA
jgi:hypothetical protein